MPGRKPGLDFSGDIRIIRRMPIFEYHCKGCGTEFEALVRSGAAPECPSCHATTLDKKLSVFATAGSGSGGEPAPTGAMGPCGTCGDPRGPGSCAIQ